MSEGVKSRIDKMSNTRAVVLLLSFLMPVCAGACVEYWLLFDKRDIWFGALTLSICIAYMIFVFVLFGEKIQQIDDIWMQRMKSYLGDVEEDESTSQMTEREKRKLYYRRVIRKRFKRD